MKSRGIMCQKSWRLTCIDRLNYYLRQEGWVCVIVIVCLFVCLSVSNCAKTYNRICVKFAGKANEQMTKFWWWSGYGPGYGSGSYHDTGKKCLGGGMHCPSASSYYQVFYCKDTRCCVLFPIRRLQLLVYMHIYSTVNRCQLSGHSMLRRLPSVWIAYTAAAGRPQDCNKSHDCRLIGEAPFPS